MSIRDYQMALDTYNDQFEDDSPPSRCLGPDYDQAHGCGRFLSTGAWMCDRCATETTDYWREYTEREADEDRRIAQAQADEAAYWARYWASPEGQAQIAVENEALEAYAYGSEDLPL